LTITTYALLLRENVDKKHNFLERAADHIKLARDNPQNEREAAHFKVQLVDSYHHNTTILTFILRLFWHYTTDNQDMNTKL
jgi:hypothetical protein